MSSSTNTTATHPFRPFFTPDRKGIESPAITALIHALSLQPHPEGGYFVETDRSPSLVPSPFPAFPISSDATADPSTSRTETPSETDSASRGAENEISLPQQRPGFDSAFRNASTTIFYLLTPKSPQGSFHVNRGRTIHTLHAGRGQYVIIHADEADGGAEEGTKWIETFVVGPDVENGERLQWIVEGGKYKASFLLPDVEGEEGGSERGLLISETVVPGFEFWDHGFLGEGGLRSLVGEKNVRELRWLVRGAED